jgi:hypothetical protein
MFLKVMTVRKTKLYYGKNMVQKIKDINLKQLVMEDIKFIQGSAVLYKFPMDQLVMGCKFL